MPIPGSGGGSAPGLYRAIVLNNMDPARRGRIQVMVPAIAGQASGWAECCGPPGGCPAPPVGATAWVMFENGDPAYPVWMGVMPS
ncbi:MAG: phage baseplate assembly protein V [Acetobacteraceae bacterium]|nr:phage baseplate assembly protein V [Acetobacteraceae bacterium]